MPVGGLVVLLAVAGAATATHTAVDTEGHTTLEQILTATDPDADYTTLAVDAGQTRRTSSVTPTAWSKRRARSGGARWPTSPS